MKVKQCYFWRQPKSGEYKLVSESEGGLWVYQRENDGTIVDGEISVPENFGKMLNHFRSIYPLAFNNP